MSTFTPAEIHWLAVHFAHTDRADCAGAMERDGKALVVVLFESGNCAEMPFNRTEFQAVQAFAARHPFRATNNPVRPAATFGAACSVCGEGIMHDNHLPKVVR